MKESEIEIGFSPCPNDTFMFYAMVQNRIDTEGIKFIPVMQDVEELNKLALTNSLPVTKVSFQTAGKILNNYSLFTSGSALGKGCGPLLIGKRIYIESELEKCSVAIPGKNTTAFHLLKKFFPKLTNVHEMIFSAIENAVINEETDLGLIIHENRFTYEKKGLKKQADLGELWERATGFPIPLGGIVGKKNLGLPLLQSINRIMKRSIEYAYKNPEETMPFVQQHSQELSEDVIRKHIELYVNNLSIDLGEEGQAAVKYFLNVNDSELFVH